MLHTTLILDVKCYDSDLQLAKWSTNSNKLIKSTFLDLRESLLNNLAAYCMDLRGRGGVKGSIRACLKSFQQ